MTTRRQVLRGLGTALALPFLPSIAHATTAPRRLVIIYSHNGQNPVSWLPTGSETAFTLSPILQSFSPYLDRVVVSHGASGTGGHYQGHSEVLTGRGSSDTFTATGGPSIDQLVAAQHAGQTPLPSLELGWATDSGITSVASYNANRLPIPAVRDPLGAFQRITRAAASDPVALARRQTRGLSVLDSVVEDYRALQSVLSAGERRVLDAHLTLVEEQEQLLLNPPAPRTCALPDAPAPDLGNELALPAQFANLAIALGCDLTRVATVVIGETGSIVRHPWLGVDDMFHEIAHNSVPDATNKQRIVNTWYADQIATFLGLLDAMPEDGGTVLDHTLVVWTNELGLSDHNHYRDSMPVLFAGATGILDGGRFVDLDGYSYQDLLLTIGRMAGLDQLTTFGDAGNTVVSPLLV